MFTILLEYWCKADYKALINELEDKQQLEVKDLHKSYDSKIEDLNEIIHK